MVKLGCLEGAAAILNEKAVSCKQDFALSQPGAHRQLRAQKIPVSK
jgi:hypothetical protein